MESALVIVFWLLWGFGAKAIANRKGHSGGFWGTMALLFGPIAFVVALLLPRAT